MAHHRFDPLAALERLTTFAPAKAQRRERRARQRDAQRLGQFITTTSRRMREELEVWIRIAEALDAGDEPTEVATVHRLTDLPGVAEYLALAERIERRSAGDAIQPKALDDAHRLGGSRSVGELDGVRWDRAS